MQNILGVIGCLVGALMFAFILPFILKGTVLLMYGMIEACAYLYNFSAHLVHL